MAKLTKPIVREIIDDFVQEIERRKTKGPKPSKEVINFRNELKTGFERDVWLVPAELLLYRKDNGRIASDVLNYEKNFGKLDEKTEEGQKIIRKFLEDKDEEKTKELMQSVKHEGQREPAIITCDGFLINGNRRKMVLEKLHGQAHDIYMKVVILPGKDDQGGSPSQLEIEQIENRYQLQSDGKAEYYAFDRALSIKRKMALGMSLEDQLKDDPVFAGLDDKKFKKAVRDHYDEYLKPLECIDRYLALLGREELYGTISTGMGDREGRWQAFLDYYNFVYKKLEDAKQRMELGVEDKEVGKIESVAFKIIRLRGIEGISDMSKVHQVMRKLGHWLKNRDAKKELMALANIGFELPKNECCDKDGNEYEMDMIDRLWCNKNRSEIIRRVKKAKFLRDNDNEREITIILLEKALEILNDDSLDPETVPFDSYLNAMKSARDIGARAKEIEAEFYHLQKKNNEFLKNKKSK
ncbi:MAG: hypothetical protein PHP73_00940 [Candidatus Omnitrophica bacterium]|nr:hypothetical protein [Candidatus Omnitrophota bacterium]